MTISTTCLFVYYFLYQCLCLSFRLLNSNIYTHIPTDCQSAYCLWYVAQNRQNCNCKNKNHEEAKRSYDSYDFTKCTIASFASSFNQFSLCVCVWSFFFVVLCVAVIAWLLLLVFLLLCFLFHSLKSLYKNRFQSVCWCNRGFSECALRCTSFSPNATLSLSLWVFKRLFNIAMRKFLFTSNRHPLLSPHNFHLFIWSTNFGCCCFCHCHCHRRYSNQYNSCIVIQHFIIPQYPRWLYTIHRQSVDHNSVIQLTITKTTTNTKLLEYRRPICVLIYLANNFRI